MTAASKYQILAVLALMVLFSIFFYKPTICNFPSHIHAWTQSDRLAIALGYLDNGFEFFKPRTMNLRTVDGVTSVDLPLNEYVVAILMKVFGTRAPAVFRVYTLCISLLGFVFLFRLSRVITNSFEKSLVVTLFAFSCPIIVYYQAGFIPSSTALAATFMAYYFYFHFKKYDRINSFYLTVLLLTLASLMRSPFNIFLFAVLLHQSFVYFRKRKVNWKEVGALAGAYVTIAAYNAYKTYLSETYGSQFLTFLRPAEIGELFSITAEVFRRWWLQLFTVFHYVLLSIVGISLGNFLLSGNKLSGLKRELTLHTIIVLCGAGIYYALMSKQFVEHEYYFIDSFYLGLILFFILGIDSLDINKPQKMIWSGLFALLIAGGVWASKQVQEQKYTTKVWDRGEVTRENFIGSERLLDDLGVPKEAKMLVVDAYSTNAPLILMNRKGYTVVSTERKDILIGLEYDFDYLVMQDIFMPSDAIPNYPEFLEELKRVGGNGRISIFKMDKKIMTRSIEELLGVTTTHSIEKLNFDSNQTSETWFNVNRTDSAVSRSAPNSYFLNPQIDYGPTCVLEKSATANRVLFESYVKTGKEGLNGVYVVLSMKQADKEIYYKSHEIKLPPKESWQVFQCLFVVPEGSGYEMKLYIWNKEKKEAGLDDLKLTTYSI